MSVKVKDQDLSKLKKIIEEKRFKDAYALIDELALELPIKKYNLAYVKFHEGKSAESMALLEQIKYNGMYSKEVSASLSHLKEQLGLTPIESEYSKLDNFTLEASSYPTYFIPSIAALLGILCMVFALKKQKLFSVVTFIFSVSFVVLFFIVNSFQVEINQREVTIYRGPSKIFDETQVLPVGARFISTKESDGWKYIEYPSLFQGWIKDNKAIKQ